MRLIKKFLTPAGPLNFSIYPKGFSLWTDEEKASWLKKHSNAINELILANENLERYVRTRSNIPLSYLYTDPQTGMTTTRHYSGKPEALNLWNPELLVVLGTLGKLGKTGTYLIGGLGAYGLTLNAGPSSTSWLGKGDDWIQASADFIGGEARPSRALIRDFKGKVVSEDPESRKLDLGRAGWGLNTLFTLILPLKYAGGIASAELTPILLSKVPFHQELAPGLYVVKGPNGYLNFDWDGGVVLPPSKKSNGWLAKTTLRAVRDPAKYIPKKVVREAIRTIPDEVSDLFFKEFISPKSKISWSPETWFKTRTFDEADPFKLTKTDVETFIKHVTDEYLSLSDLLVKSGQLRQNSNHRWEGKFGNEWKLVDPNEYVVAHSKAAKAAGILWDGTHYYSGMTSDNARKLQKSGGLGAEKWTTSNRNGVAEHYKWQDPWGQSPALVTEANVPYLQIIGSGNSSAYKVGNSPLLHISEYLQRDSNGNASGVTHFVNEYIDDASMGSAYRLGPYSNPGVGTTKVIGIDVPVKSILENNGNFNWSDPNIFAFNEHNSLRPEFLLT